MKREMYLLITLVCMMIGLMSFSPVGSCEEMAFSDPETIYQVALLQSLAQGHFDGIIPVGELKAHGDTGIGTFEGVNGEMIVLDGVVYQAIHDGSIVIPPDSETIPFSNVTFFEPDIQLRLTDVPDMASLQEQLNQVVRENGANLFYMVKITGEYPAIKVRSEYKQEKPYRELDAALAADQTEFDYENIRGTMVGLYCPSFMGGLNSVGWHFHFITEDLTRGGHVLQVSLSGANASFDLTPGLTLALPEEDGGFQSMDLSRNMDEAIHRAETATSSNAPSEAADAPAEPEAPDTQADQARQMVKEEDIILIDSEGVLVYLTGDWYIDRQYLCHDAVIVNDTDFSGYMYEDNSLINGWLAEGGYSYTCPAHGKNRTTIKLSLRQAGVTALEEIQTIQLNVRVDKRKASQSFTCNSSNESN